MRSGAQDERVMDAHNATARAMLNVAQPIMDEKTTAMLSLEKLLRAKCEAEAEVESRGLLNVAGASYQLRIEMDIDYQRARDRATFARDAYNTALQDFARRFP